MGQGSLTLLKRESVHYGGDDDNKISPSLIQRRYGNQKEQRIRQWKSFERSLAHLSRSKDD